MKKINKILIVGGLHGDEPTGIKIAGYFKKNKVPDISSIFANIKAVKNKIRFIETDLNRSFAVSLPLSYEEFLAKDITKKLKNYNLIIDFHNSVAKGTNCSIVTQEPNKLHLQISASLGFENLLIMPPSGSLISMNPGKSISIEIAYESIKQYSAIKLIDRIENLQLKKINIDNVKIYKYIATLKKPTLKRVKIKLGSVKNFIELTNDQKGKLRLDKQKKYYPVFAGSDYSKDHGFILVEKQN